MAQTRHRRHTQLAGAESGYRPSWLPAHAPCPRTEHAALSDVAPRQGGPRSRRQPSACSRIADCGLRIADCGSRIADRADRGTAADRCPGSQGNRSPYALCKLLAHGARKAQSELEASSKQARRESTDQDSRFKAARGAMMHRRHGWAASVRNMPAMSIYRARGGAGQTARTQSGDNGMAIQPRRPTTSKATVVRSPPCQNGCVPCQK